MQVQTLTAGNSMPVQHVADSAARHSSGSLPLPGNTETQIGGMQKNAVTGAGALEKQTAATQENVDQAVQQVNDMLQILSQKLEFSVDKETEAFVVTVVDKETKEVIRQIPSEEMLELAKTLDKLQGFLIRDKA